MTRLPHPAKAIIVSRGLTLRTVATEVGVNSHTFGRVLNGHESPWPALRRRLSAYLEVPADELWHDDERAGVAR